MALAELTSRLSQALLFKFIKCPPTAFTSGTEKHLHCIKFHFRFVIFCTVECRLIYVYVKKSFDKLDAELNEFEPRLKFETRLKYG